MSELFDWNGELSEFSQRLQEANSNTESLHQFQKQESDELTQLYSEIMNLAQVMGVSVEDVLGTPNQQHYYESRQLQWDDEFYLSDNPLMLEAKVKEEVFRNPEILPSLSGIDYAIVGISAMVASLLDFLIVSIPKDINYLGKYQQKGSNFTGWLRTLGINKDGKLIPFLKWCENVCQVPYDQSINPSIQGFNPRSHRLFSLSHDPLFGLIFGTLDILNGSMTTFGANGNIQIVKTVDVTFNVTAHRNCVAVLQMRSIGRLSQAGFDKSGSKHSFCFVS